MNKNKQIKTKTATPTIKTIKITQAIITKMTINNYQNQFRTFSVTIRFLIFCICTVLLSFEVYDRESR